VAKAGYTGTVKASGVAVVMTAEPLALVSGFVYQITNTAKRLIDPATALVVKENGVPSVLAYTVNYLYGIVTFPSAPTTPITVDGAYLPLANVAESKGYTLGLTQDMLDRTSFDSAGAMQKLAGLKDATVKLERVSINDDIDPVTGGVQSVESRFAAGTPYVIELGLGGTDSWRGWVTTAGVEIGASVDSLVAESVDFESSPQLAGAAWSFSS
jgi:predicted secreted protein